MLERGIDARHASSCKRPISGYLQAEPRMPRVIDFQFGTMGFVSRDCITILARIGHWRGTRHFHERSKRRRRERSSQSLKSEGCIIVTDEPHDVGDPLSSVVISIKSMEILPARAEIDVRCCRATRRRRELESSIRRRDRYRIIGEWALHRQAGFFGTDSPRHFAARGSRNAAISSLLRASRTSPTNTGWFQVLPSIALKRATSTN
jgi:hypothetical protein